MFKSGIYFFPPRQRFELFLHNAISASLLGLIFFMAGWWKTFELGPLGHA